MKLPTIHLPYKLLLSSCLASLVLGVNYPRPMWLGYVPSLIVAFLFILFGIIISFWAKHTILSSDTTLDPYGQSSALTQDGPFRFSRNPMYLAYLAIALGIAFGSGGLVTFIAPFIYFLYLNFRMIPQEEKKLRALFPAQYAVYVQKVRRWV
jgi:protein-S-isoprenylcysteine O-methyltransferase Ste14